MVPNSFQILELNDFESVPKNPNGPNLHTPPSNTEILRVCGSNDIVDEMQFRRR
jgi:hypothetical protein